MIVADGQRLVHLRVLASPDCAAGRSRLPCFDSPGHYGEYIHLGKGADV